MRCTDAGAVRREAQTFEDDSDAESVGGQSVPWEYDASLFDDFDCEVDALSEDTGDEESDVVKDMSTLLKGIGTPGGPASRPQMPSPGTESSASTDAWQTGSDPWQSSHRKSVKEVVLTMPQTPLDLKDCVVPSAAVMTPKSSRLGV